MPHAKLHKCDLCDEARFFGSDFCEGHTRHRPQRKEGQCESCEAPVLSPFVCCQRCLWESGERAATEARERRMAQTAKIKSEIAYVWDLWERIPEEGFLERYSLEKRVCALWSEIEGDS